MAGILHLLDLDGEYITLKLMQEFRQVSTKNKREKRANLATCDLEILRATSHGRTKARVECHPRWRQGEEILKDCLRCWDHSEIWLDLSIKTQNSTFETEIFPVEFIQFVTATGLFPSPFKIYQVRVEEFLSCFLLEASFEGFRVDWETCWEVLLSSCVASRAIASLENNQKSLAVVMSDH